MKFFTVSDVFTVVWRENCFSTLEEARDYALKLFSEIRPAVFVDFAEGKNWEGYRLDQLAKLQSEDSCDLIEIAAWD